MRRREFLPVGVAAAWLLAARAQHGAMLVIGFLNAAFARAYARPLAAFLKGLGEAGYVDGRNVTIEYRWAEGQNDRPPALSADRREADGAGVESRSTGNQDAPSSTFGRSPVSARQEAC